MLHVCQGYFIFKDTISKLPYSFSNKSIFLVTNTWVVPIKKYTLNYQSHNLWGVIQGNLCCIGKKIRLKLRQISSCTCNLINIKFLLFVIQVLNWNRFYYYLIIINFIINLLKNNFCIVFCFYLSWFLIFQKNIGFRFDYFSYFSIFELD